MKIIKHQAKHYSVDIIKNIIRWIWDVEYNCIVKFTRKKDLFDALIRFDISNIGYQHVQTWPNENSSTESRFASSAH